jgi:hypothetical protein
VSNLKSLHSNKPSNNLSHKHSLDTPYLPNRTHSKRPLNQPQFLSQSPPKEHRCPMNNKFLLNSQTGIRILSLEVKNSLMILHLPNRNNQKHHNLPGTIIYLRILQNNLNRLKLTRTSRPLHKWIFLLTMVFNNLQHNPNPNNPQVKYPRHHLTLSISLMTHRMANHHSKVHPKTLRI